MKLYYVDKPELDRILQPTAPTPPTTYEDGALFDDLADLGVDKTDPQPGPITTNLSVLLDALRLNVLYMVQQAGSGHLGGSLSSLSIMVDLFWNRMNPEDIFISSKGHDAPGLYALMQARGIIPFETIHTLRRPGGLPGHPTIDVPGIYFNTGSLGMGISKANGLAAADRMNGIHRKIYVLVGDGELQEGQIYESSWRREGKVRIVIDCNGYQLSKPTELPGLLPEKNVRVVPTAKGAGISFMENDNKYHAGALSADEYARAAAEISGRLFNAGIAIKPTHDQPYPRPAKSHELTKAYGGRKQNPGIAPRLPGILESVGQNPKVIVMDADLEPDCGLTHFKEKYPDRFIECGIAEQDMVSMATGLAEGGFIPIVHSFAAFLCRRANEQIYNACLERRHIVFVGSMAGLLPTGPGTSHQCLEDIALMKTMPGMTILAPKTADALWSALAWAVDEATGPVYISIQCWDLEAIRQ